MLGIFGLHIATFRPISPMHTGKGCPVSAEEHVETIQDSLATGVQYAGQYADIRMNFEHNGPMFLPQRQQKRNNALSLVNLKGSSQSAATPKGYRIAYVLFNFTFTTP